MLFLEMGWGGSKPPASLASHAAQDNTSTLSSESDWDNWRDEYGFVWQFEPPNPMVIMVDYHCIIYIYTHKHIFQSRTVNFGVCRPIFRHTHINDFRICFIFFVPFPAVGEGRRTSTNVRYLGGRWLATFQWFLTELLRVMTWCHRQLGHLGTFCAEVPSGGARVQTCKRICEVSSDFACSKKSSFEKRDFDNGRAKSRIDLVHVDMNHPKPQEVSSGHNMSL